MAGVTRPQRLMMNKTAIDGVTIDSPTYMRTQPFTERSYSGFGTTAYEALKAEFRRAKEKKRFRDLYEVPSSVQSIYSAFCNTFGPPRRSIVDEYTSFALTHWYLQHIIMLKVAIAVASKPTVCLPLSSLSEETLEALVFNDYGDRKIPVSNAEDYAKLASMSEEMSDKLTQVPVQIKFKEPMTLKECRDFLINRSRTNHMYFLLSQRDQPIHVGVNFGMKYFESQHPQWNQRLCYSSRDEKHKRNEAEFLQGDTYENFMRRFFMKKDQKMTEKVFEGFCETCLWSVINEEMLRWQFESDIEVECEYTFRVPASVSCIQSLTPKERMAVDDILQQRLKHVCIEYAKRVQKNQKTSNKQEVASHLSGPRMLRHTFLTHAFEY